MSKEKKFLVNQGSLQQLVGELKIAIQRVQSELKYTKKEEKDMLEYIKQWEEILYD